MRISQSPCVHGLQISPTCVGTGMPQRERFRICEVPERRLLLPRHGLAHAIPSDQVFNAAGLLRSNGGTRGTQGPPPAFDRTGCLRVRFSSSPTGFAATWTIFQDTPIVRLHSCCATFASVSRPTPSSSPQLWPRLPVP